MLRASQIPRAFSRTRLIPQRTFSQSSLNHRKLNSDQEIEEFLSKPTWSVRSLLPTAQQIQESTEVTTEQLHRLLRLSALPLPQGSQEEEKMLHDLRAQLHFVREIQKVDTDGVEPMKSIRPEPAALGHDEEITLKDMQTALSQEEVIGTYAKRIRRRQTATRPDPQVEGWDVLGQAPNKAGRFFVVNATGS